MKKSARSDGATEDVVRLDLLVKRLDHAPWKHLYTRSRLCQLAEGSSGIRKRVKGRLLKMNTSCLLSIAQLLRESPRLDNIKEKEKQDKHLIIVTSTQIDHDMLISVKVG